MCASVACRRMRAEGSAWCWHHLNVLAFGAGVRDGMAARSAAEYEAARIHDPERARWDAWDDGGLERPGEDEF